MSGPQPIINEHYRSGWDKAFAKTMTKKHGPKKKPAKSDKPIRRSLRSQGSAARH